MTITRLEAVSIWDKPPNVSGAFCYGYLDTVLSWELTRRLDATHSAVVVAPISGNAPALGVERRVLALHFEAVTPGDVGEVVPLRIAETERLMGPDGLTVRLTARSMLFDWTDCGPMSYVFAGGKHEFAITGELTAAQWMSQYALPHLARQGYDWYTFAAANGLRIPRAFTRETPLQLLNACADYLGWETRVTVSGGALLVELVQAINGTLEPLRITAGGNLRRAGQKRATAECATVLVPFGGKGHSEASRSVQPFVFTSASDDFVAKTLGGFPTSDSGWLFPVVVRDGQYVSADPARRWYLQRQKTGRCFPIIATAAPTLAYPGGQFTLADLTPVVGGNLYAIREGLTPGTPLDMATPGVPLEVQSRAGNVVTIANPFTGADPVPTDDQHIDARVRRSVLRLATTSSSVAAVAGSTTDVDVTVASTAGVVAGDWGFAHDNASQPWTLFGKVFTVVQVVSGTVLRVRKRYTFDTTAVPFSAGSMSKQLRLYTAQATVAYVNGESATANTLTLDDASAFAAGHLVEYTVDNSGAVLTGLPSPAVGTYGIARKDKDFPTARCVPNLALQANPVFNLFSGTTVPDGWTGTCTKVTSNLPGPGTVHAAQLAGSSLHTITSPVIYARPTDGDSKVSVRVRLRTGSGSFWDSSLASHRTVIEVLVAGTTTVLGSTTIIGPGYPSPPAGYTEVAPNTVVDVDVLAVDLLHTPGAAAKYAPVDGVQVRISTIFGGGTIVVGGIFVSQDSALPADGYITETGTIDLYGLGQLALDARDEPEMTNSLDTVDLQRALGAAYGADEIIEGRTVRVEVEALSLALEDRIAAATYRGAEDGSVQVQVSTRTRQFADVLANYLTRT